jgi:formate-dependent nitrite reductase cytochrome c552 subunit
MKFFNLRVMIVSLAFALVGLSGVAVAGDEGCVSCHMGPMALNEVLAKVEGHPDVGMMVNTIPTDCAMCHAKDSDVALMGIIHPRHDGVDCQSCHVVDENNMPTGVKTGAKNW